MRSDTGWVFIAVLIFFKRWVLYGVTNFYINNISPSDIPHENPPPSYRWSGRSFNIT